MQNTDHRYPAAGSSWLHVMLHYAHHCDACGEWSQVGGSISWKEDHLKDHPSCVWHHHHEILSYKDMDAASLPMNIYFAPYCEVCNIQFPRDANMGTKVTHLKARSICRNGYEQDLLAYRHPETLKLPPSFQHSSSVSQSQGKQLQANTDYSRYSDQQASSSSSGPQGNTHQQGPARNAPYYPQAQTTQQYTQDHSQYHDYYNEGA